MSAFFFSAIKNGQTANDPLAVILKPKNEIQLEPMLMYACSKVKTIQAAFTQIVDHKTIV